MYLAFIDESGDPGLWRANPEYPVFALAAVVCLEREYSARIEPQLRQLRHGEAAVVRQDHCLSTAQRLRQLARLDGLLGSQGHELLPSPCKKPHRPDVDAAGRATGHVAL